MRRCVSEATRLALLLCVTGTAAHAWGPKASLTIVTTAENLLSKGSNIPLARYARDLQAGATLAPEKLVDLMPDAVSNPAAAIEAEMYLLQAVRAHKLDAYFAYRMGALGRVVADLTSPMLAANPTYRAMYDSDTDNNIQNAALQAGKRDQVDPKMYFAPLTAAAAANNSMIQREYQAGTGFRGVAAAALGVDASRSVDAVADVWSSILTGNASGNVSEAQLQRYVLNALAYYIQRGNVAEIEAAAQRFQDVAPITPDMHVRLGDLYVQAKLLDKAMREYKAVLASQPDRRDVVQKISAYYVQQGQDALDNGKLEAAEENFQNAATADPLHPTAESQRLKVASLINERNAREEANQAALDQAQKFESMAEEEALKNRYAEAIALLRQASDVYGQVTDEFPAEAQQRAKGQSNVRYRMDELKQGLMANAQMFSGTAFKLDTKMIAQEKSKGLDVQALKALTKNSYQAELNQLQNKLQAEVAP